MKKYLIDTRSGIKEINVDEYMRCKIGENEFDLLLYSRDDNKYMLIVKEICGALYTIPYRCDISAAELVEKLDVNRIPKYIFPTFRYEESEKEEADVRIKLLDCITRIELDWYKNPSAYFMQDKESKSSDFLNAEQVTDLPVMEFDRYVVAYEERLEDSYFKYRYQKYMKKFSYMLKEEAKPSDIAEKGDTLTFIPAPTLNGISFSNIPRIVIDEVDGTDLSVLDYKREIEVEPGTTFTTILTMPDETTITVAGLALPSKHIYNLHYAYTYITNKDILDLLPKADKITMESDNADTIDDVFRSGISRSIGVTVGNKKVDPIIQPPFNPDPVSSDSNDGWYVEDTFEIVGNSREDEYNYLYQNRSFRYKDHLPERNPNKIER